MNGKKAKALRRKLKMQAGQERKYEGIAYKDELGRIKVTVRNSPYSLRSLYQYAKSHPTEIGE